MTNPSKKRNVQNVIVLLLLAILIIPIGYANVKNPNTLQQERILKGTVYNSKGLPLEDVAVLNNLFKDGTATDKNGNYSIAVKTGDKLIFSFIGYETQVFEISNQEVLNVTMKENVEDLEEVVLVGYGKKKKENLATAVSVIKPSTLTKTLQPGITLDRGLSGLIKGVNVVQGSGEPGKGVDINIRGITSPFASHSNNNPLYVIDGAPFFTDPESGISPLTSINPEDIESISVLKDAASTAIYGSRGANGVILIKTKQGKLNRGLQTSVTVSTSIGKPIGMTEFLNAEEYKNYTLKALKNSLDFAKKNSGYSFVLMNYSEVFEDLGIEHKGLEMKGNPPKPYMKYAFSPEKVKFYNGNTNWTKEIYRGAAITNNYNFSFTGGGSSVFYNASLRYLDQEGLIKEENYDQYNLRLSLGANLTKSIVAGFSTNIGLTKHKWGYNKQGDLVNALKTRPDIAPYDEAGKLTFIKKEKKNIFAPNPLALFTKNENSRNATNAIINAYVEVKPLQGLRLKGSVSGSMFLGEKKIFTPGKYKFNGYEYVDDEGKLLPAPQSYFSNAKGKARSITLDFTANYTKKIELHHMEVMLGASRYRTYQDSESHYAKYYTTDDNFTLPTSGDNIKSDYTPTIESGINSGLSRLNYGYDNRYLVTGTIRFDQSSKFSYNNRLAWFPSVAVSWNIHNESFFKKASKTVNRLSLRGSYGITGSTNIADFTYTKMFYSKGTYNGDKAIAAGNRLINQDIGWEKTKEFDVGLDLEMLNAKIAVGIDVYNKTTHGAIMNLSFPLSTGATTYSKNFGVINNRGIEFDINAYIIDKKDFSLSLGLNASKNINKLEEADFTNMSDNERARFAIGKSTSLLRGYVVEGIIPDSKTIEDLNKKAKEKGFDYYSGAFTAAGDYLYKDVDKNGTINEKDAQEIIGDASPEWFGGFNTRIRYKNFELSTQFGFSYGADMLRFSQSLVNSPLENVEKRFDIENRWSPENKTATLPRLVYMGSQNLSPSSATIFDASYIKWRSLQLNYSLPDDIIQNMGLSRINIFVKANNLYTWSEYPGVDPEGVGAGMAHINTGKSLSDPYPTSKSWTLGLQINF